MRPGSGRDGYYGVQFAVRPGPVLLPARPRRAPPPRAAAGGRPPVPGAGRRRPRRTRCSATTTSSSPARSSRPPRPASLALGDEALWDLPPGLSLPPGTSLTAGRGRPTARRCPVLVNGFLAQALARAERCASRPIPRGASWTPTRWWRGCVRPPARSSGAYAPRPRPPNPERSLDYALDYQADVGPNLRLIVLDLARRDGGSGGLVPPRPAWLASQPAEHGAGGGALDHRRLPPAARRAPRAATAARRCSTTHPRVIADAVRPHPPQPDRAPDHRRRRLLADQHGVADRLSPAGPGAAGRSRRGRRRRDPDVDARPRLPGASRHDLPRALLPRRAGRAPEGIRRRPSRSQRDAVPRCLASVATERGRDVRDRGLLGIALGRPVLPMGVGDVVGQREHELAVVVDLVGRRFALEHLDRVANVL